MADTVNNLAGIVGKFRQASILVVGDLILDEYVWGNVERISPEAPVPVVSVKERNFKPGGAANVAANLSALGAKVSVLGVVGNDKYSKDLVDELQARGIDHSGIITEKGRRTTLKSRVLAGHQQVVRIDCEDVGSLKAATQEKIKDFIQSRLKKFQAVIIEDYGKGVIDKHTLPTIIRQAKQDRTIITVDPKEEHFELYKGVTAITPNRKEAQNAVRYLKMIDDKSAFKVYNDKLFTVSQIHHAGRELMEHLQLENLLMTLGEQGMMLFEKGKQPEHIPTVAQEVFDVSGAGDTAIAVFTLARACGASPLEAARLANAASGIVVGKVGTETITRQELLDKIKEL